MSTKPIFVATHPRACSTAFERVFMTRTDILNCIHEPFGDAFYYGPERLSERYEDDEEAREKSGFAGVTYKDVLDRLDEEIAKDKRVFIKDIIHYLAPPDAKPATIAPSLADLPNSSSVPNPTVLPVSALRRFHFTFLIRHPRRAIPSYFRCTVPPLDKVTGFYHFLPSEAGYDELRRIFDFLRAEKIVGPAVSVGSSSKQQPNGTAATAAVNGDTTDKKGEEEGEIKITVIDADDLLDHPHDVIKAYCGEVGIDFKPEMLVWEDEEQKRRAAEAFEKWNGFHDDAIGSTSLKARVNGAKTPTIEEENQQWREKFGEEGQKVIRQTVDANIPDYEYLKSFAMKF
ncbi:hypothetical protein QBC47DRAFT_182390 [Echria macrotheca]|uniref:P-loop containing nucleoside triphosphate hydrolase protein n=1 Tax=Echria macrotheca TaxID=438768 RepID=A0AAJ0BFB5_9PEZI|nr:hypothetical protein QBC47DRAFT_182390 [Echria macrotheca]